MVILFSFYRRFMHKMYCEKKNIMVLLVGNGPLAQLVRASGS